MANMHKTAPGVDRINKTRQTREQHRLARTSLVLLGLTMTVVGVLALLPVSMGHTTLVLGLFQAGTLPGLARLVSGLVTLAMAAAPRFRPVRWYALVIGLVFGVISIAGGVGGTVFGLYQASAADDGLHALVAVVALGIWGLTEAWSADQVGKTV